MQTKFCSDVLAFAEVVAQLGNPYHSSNGLKALHTQEIMDHDLVTSLRQLQDLGQDLHWKFVSQAIKQATFAYENTLKHQKVLTFINHPVDTKMESKLGSAQRNSLS